MQDFIDQAEKNSIALVNKGKCQFCGGDFQEGVFECMNHYNHGLELIDSSTPQYNISRFLSVDAHALQHPEIHGRWSNHFHLTRLNLILDKKQLWDYTRSPRLSHYLNEYKLGRPDETLSPPPLLRRGNITSKELSKITTAEECIAFIRKWAEEVYHTWSSNHPTVSKIADGFMLSAYRKTS